MRFVSVLTFVVILLTGGVAMAERLSVSSKIANIRSGPGTGYDILWKVESYYPILVLKKSGSWINFRDFEGDEGWIHESLVDKKPTVITIKDKCNVRDRTRYEPRCYFYGRKRNSLSDSRSTEKLDSNQTYGRGQGLDTQVPGLVTS